MLQNPNTVKTRCLKRSLGLCLVVLLLPAIRLSLAKVLVLHSNLKTLVKLKDLLKTLILNKKASKTKKYWSGTNIGASTKMFYGVVLYSEFQLRINKIQKITARIFFI